MTRTLAIAALFATAALPALAQTFTINKIEINGVTSVPIQPLRDGLKDKPGSRVTTDDVLADHDQLTKLLEAAHVTGGVKTSLRNYPNGRKDIIFTVTDNGVQKPVVVTTALHLAHLSFSGNKYATADDLAAAAQAKPGDVVTDQSLAAMGARIQAEYKKQSDLKATQAAKTNITPQITYPQQGQVDIVWQFTETTAKTKKKRNTEDEGFKTEAQ